MSRITQAVVVSGASGLVGSACTRLLREQGVAVRELVRGAPRGAEQYAWDPASGRIDPAAFAGASAVVHLAGENIASGRWTDARKQRILRSRVDGTRLIAGAIAAAAAPPALICASAVGYYGDRGDEPLEETSQPGAGFLAEVCRAWEAATEPAQRAGARVVRLRLGIVLSRAGGALPRMLLPFRFGAGGPIGDGRQFMSWIAIDDLVRVIERAASDMSVAGAINAVAPEPVRNGEFAAAVGRVLHRPARLRLPAAIVRLALGEMGRELLLAGARVRPAVLQRCGFDFRYPGLEGALRRELGRAGAS